MVTNQAGRRFYRGLLRGFWRRSACGGGFRRPRRRGARAGVGKISCPGRYMAAAALLSLPSTPGRRVLSSAIVGRADIFQLWGLGPQNFNERR